MSAVEEETYTDNHPRKPWIVVLLTLLMPGLGQVYNGQLKTGLLFYGWTLLISVCFMPLLLVPWLVPLNLLAALLAVPAIAIFLMIQGVSYARSLKGEYHLKPINRWYIYLAMWVLSIYVIIPSLASLLKSNFIEAYVVPSGAMENTIMAGDYIIGDKRGQAITAPQQGDVIIFKYPRDVVQKYVKRLIGMPGQTIEIREKKVFVDGEEYLLLTHGKFKDSHILSPDNKRRGEVMFLREGGNRDNLGPIKIPKKGDSIPVDAGTNWDYLLPIMIMDGHRVTLDIIFQDREYIFIMDDPGDLARRYSSGLWLKIRSFFTRQPSSSKKIDKLYRQYFSPTNQQGKFLNVWNFKLSDEILKYLNFDGKPVNEMDSYTVEQDYYWMMGDNRDDSADSRYWGFVPHDWVLGKPLYIYWSWDFKNGKPRFSRVGTIIS